MFDMLMDMMSQKFWIQSSLDDLAKDEEVKKSQNAKVEYDKGNTKNHGLQLLRHDRYHARQS